MVRGSACCGQRRLGCGLLCLPPCVPCLGEGVVATVLPDPLVLTPPPPPPTMPPPPPTLVLMCIAKDLRPPDAPK